MLKNTKLKSNPKKVKQQQVKQKRKIKKPTIAKAPFSTKTKTPFINTLFRRGFSTETGIETGVENGIVHNIVHKPALDENGLSLPVLNSVVAKCGLLSRRTAGHVVAEGRVFVNDQIVTSPGYRVQPEDTIKFMQRNGEILEIENPVGKPKNTQVVLFNKPPGYGCHRPGKQFNAHTIYECLPPALVNFHYVGRLDNPAGGLLLLTNDGVFVNNVAHPSRGVEKEYLITTVKPINPYHMAKMMEGFNDGDDFLKCEAIVDISKHAPHAEFPHFYSIVMSKGLKREVRRLIAADDNNHVMELQRIRVGSLLLGNIPTGQHRFLTPEELDLCFKPYTMPEGEASHIPPPIDRSYSEVARFCEMRRVLPGTGGSYYEGELDEDEPTRQVTPEGHIVESYNGVKFDADGNEFAHLPPKRDPPAYARDNNKPRNNYGNNGNSRYNNGNNNNNNNGNFRSSNNFNGDRPPRNNYNNNNNYNNDRPRNNYNNDGPRNNNYNNDRPRNNNYNNDGPRNNYNNDRPRNNNFNGDRPPRNNYNNNYNNNNNNYNNDRPPRNNYNNDGPRNNYNNNFNGDRPPRNNYNNNNNDGFNRPKPGNSSFAKNDEETIF